jgi:hypothetical protein
MNKSKVLQMENFILGMRRDGSLTQEAERDENLGANPYILHSLKTLENYDISYEDGSLVTRDGYERYNTIVLADNPKQIFYHTNLTRTENIILGIVGNKWYKIMEATAHEKVIDEVATLTDGFKKPIFSWGDRVFFATDVGWYWTDSDRLYDAEDNKYYQAGIDKPNGSLRLETIAPPGQLNPTANHYIPLTRVDKRKIAFAFIPGHQITINQIHVNMRRWAPSGTEGTGSVKLTIYANYGGKPSNLYIAKSDFLPTTNIQYQYFQNHSFYFRESFTLQSGILYWGVVEGDDAYYDAFVMAHGGEPIESTDFFIGLGNYHGASPIYGESLVWDTTPATDFWDTVTDSEVAFYISGLIAERIYEYVLTYVNSTYQIESRPSSYSRVYITANKSVVFIAGYPSTSDDQVDKVRIYRRILNEDYEIEDDTSTITDTYKFLKEIDIGDYFWDSMNDDYLGAELQTFDHYRITEGDDTNDNFRGAIIPAGACIWKGRVWVFEKNNNVLYFSKKLEEDGRSGLTGDSIPDYFPLENQLQIEEESALLAIKPLANDQLAIYFRNGTIYVLWGMDEILNPPSEYSLRPMVYGLGLISSWGLTEYKSMHVYISRHGLYAFTGAPNPEYLSESIQSILNDISDTNLAKAIVIARGEEIWLLVDNDNNGYNDTIYILDLQRSVKPWRRYTYNTNVSDLLVKTLSSSSKDVLAIDEDNKYIMELNIGTLDDGAPINSYLESHRQKVKDAFIYELEIKDRYDSTDVPASYDFLITDHTQQGKHQEINPSSAMDERGHKVGTRLKSSGSFNVRLDQISVQKVDLHGIYIRYIEA